MPNDNPVMNEQEPDDIPHEVFESPQEILKSF